MGLLSWLTWFTRRPGFRRFEDSYAPNRSGMLLGLTQALVQQQARCDSIWLVAHFPDMFVQLQDFLGKRNFNYEVVQQPLTIEDAHSPAASRAGQCRIRLVLSSLIRDEAPVARAVVSEERHRLAIMICERHPLASRDAALLDFAKKLPPEVELGYLLALDDYVVRQVMRPITKTVLEQLGMNNQELITSNFITRALQRQLNRNSELYDGDRPTDSAEEWVRLNSKT